MPTYRLLFSQCMPCEEEYTDLKTAQAAMVEEADLAFKRAEQRWGHAYRERRSPMQIEIRAIVHKESPLWTRITIIKD